MHVMKQPKQGLELQISKGSYRVGPIRPVAPGVPEKCCLPDYPGEYPEYPCVAQSIRENIQRIRDFDHKEVLE